MWGAVKMSEFSEALSSYVDKKKIKIYDLARFLETDRSSLYQIIRGKRIPPSDEVINKMAE